MNTLSTARCRLVAPAALALIAIAAAPYAAAGPADLPDLRRGTWELSGTVDGKKIESRKCTSPSEDLKSENEVLQRAGCKVSPVERAGSQYTFKSDCDLKTRSGRQLKSNRTSVLTVDGDKSFRLRVRGTTNGRPIAETVVGTRHGDCKE